MKNNKTTLIIMGIALLAFLLVKIAPLISWPKTHETGKITYKKKEVSQTRSVNLAKNAWFVEPNGDTLKGVRIEQVSSNHLFGKERMIQGFGNLIHVPKEKRSLKWVENSNVSLDIIFLTADGQVIFFVKSVDTNSQINLPRNQEIEYVLELKSGFINRVGVTTSNRLIFEEF